MKPQDIYKLPVVSDPRISPDGRRVAFVVTRADEESNDYRSAIWMVPVDGSAPPVQFSSGTKRDMQPRWSPDGGQMAFVSNRGGEAAQLYVISTTGGEPRKLTDIKESASGPVWSPDGRMLAFTSVVPGPAYEEEDEKRRPPRYTTRLRLKADGGGWTADRFSHVFVVAVDGDGAARQVTQGNFQHSDPAWSPDGRRLCVSAARGDDWDIGNTIDLHLFDVDSGESTQLTRSDAMYSKPVWSPDGSTIACRVYPDPDSEPRNQQIAVIDVNSTAVRVLTTESDLQCGPAFEQRAPIWVDEETLLFPAEYHGNTHLYMVSTAGGPPELCLGGERVISDHDLRADGTIVYVATYATKPHELYRGEQQLTNFGAQFVAEVPLSTPVAYTATSKDGSGVHAWAMPPVGAEPGKRYPTLLFIHGGPYAQYRNALFDEFQVAAGAGYGVVYSNPRGSSGYGEAWGRAIRGPISGGPGWGSVDYEDVMAVMDQAIAQFDFIDPDRLGVLGGSYGGFMTAWVIAHTDRFKAACAERGVYNIMSEMGTSDEFFTAGAYFGGNVYDHVDQMLAVSPITYVNHMKTPLQIVHSEQDFRCPIEQAEQLFTALRSLGREVEFIRFPFGTHDLSRGGPPVQRVYRFNLILEWFARHLMSSDGSEPVAAVREAAPHAVEVEAL